MPLPVATLAHFDRGDLTLTLYYSYLLNSKMVTTIYSMIRINEYVELRYNSNMNGLDY